MEPLAEVAGESSAITAVREQVRRLLARANAGARSPAVLLLGETGTGKGLLARAMHRAGPRPGGPFISVNCAAVPEPLFEMELFGFERGAFTDARQAKPGLLQTAHQGTLFLDEIGLLPEPIQAKLLTVLDERLVRRLGSTRAESVDVWIIAATSLDLEAAVRERRFRDDLYHRLSVIPLRLPPLRDRDSDIVLLAEQFLTEACAAYGLPLKSLTADARAALQAYEWPGNVRQLANLMERVVLLADADAITAGALELPLPATAAVGPPIGSDSPTSYRNSLDQLERQRLTDALRRAHWNISRAADELGIPRNTLRYRISKHGLEPEEGAAGRRRPRTGGRSPEPLVFTTPQELRTLTFVRCAMGPVDASAADRAGMRDLAVGKVEAFGGVILEDGSSWLDAAFGLDLAEDAASRAANAALALRRAITHARSDRRIGTITIALHSDRCLVGSAEIVPEALREIQAVLTQLLMRAMVDSIVISPAITPLLERRFALEPSRPSGLSPTPPARPEPPHPFQLLGREPTGFGLGGRRLSRFVGRDSEMARLDELLAQVAPGRGHVIGILAEPGVGKSRLLYEFRQSLHSDRAVCLEGRCLSHAQAVPYLPLADLLRRTWHMGDSDSPLAVTTMVRRQVEGVGLNADTTAPYLLLLLGIQPEPAGLDQLTPEVIKTRTFAALRDTLFAHARSRPLVLLLEDIHWSDRLSEEFLTTLVDTLSAAPILLVATYRPGYRPPWLDRSHASQRALPPLLEQPSASIVRSVLARDGEVNAVEQEIVRRGEGNPFFLEELAWAALHAGESGVATFPPTIEAALTSRIARLAPDTRRVLEAAAIIGREVPDWLLTAVCPDADLPVRLAELVRLDFLFIRPGFGHVFKHALTHEVANQGLLHDRQRALHARITEAIERLATERVTEQTERLAHHALRGELWEKAVAYLWQSATKKTARSAYRDAVECLEQALEALAHIPEGRETIAQAIDLRLALHNALSPLSQTEKILSRLREAETLASESVDYGRLGVVFARECLALRQLGDLDAAIAVGERALAIATDLNNTDLEVMATHRLGQAYFSSGDLLRAIKLLRRAVDLFAEGRHDGGSHSDLRARAWLGLALANVGEFTEAIALGAEAVRIVESSEQPAHVIVMVYTIAGYSYEARGQFQRAITLFERALEAARGSEMIDWAPEAAVGLGRCYALSGRLADGLPLIEQAVTVERALVVRNGVSLTVGVLGRVYLLAGRLDEARECARGSRELAQKYKERGNEAHAVKLLGDLASNCATLNEPAADQHYLHAMALATELGMRPLVAHCHAGLAKLYRRTGRRDPAREHFTTAMSMYQEMGMTYWLEKEESKMRDLE